MMGLFGGRENKKPQKNQSPENYNLEEKLFPISKPWGYSPRHVSEAIMHYNQVIDSQNAAIAKLKEALARERNEKKKIDKELKNLQLQLNFVSVPTMSDIQEEYIQNQFEDQFGNGKKEEPAPKRTASKASLLRDAAEKEELKEQELQASEEPPKKKKKISVKNPFGGREDNSEVNDSVDGLVENMAEQPTEKESEDMSFDLDSFGIEQKKEVSLPKKKIAVAVKQDKLDDTEAQSMLTAFSAGLDDFVSDEDFGNAAEPSGESSFDFVGGSSNSISDDENNNQNDQNDENEEDGNQEDSSNNNDFDEFVRKYGY